MHSLRECWAAWVCLSWALLNGGICMLQAEVKDIILSRTIQ